MAIVPILVKLKIMFDMRHLPKESPYEIFFCGEKNNADLSTDEIKHILNEIEKNILEIDDGASFRDTLKKHMESKRLKASDVYVPALIEKSYFYQILRGEHIPSRDVVIRICLSLNLSLEESKELLSQLGYVFFEKNRRDIILSNCIRFRQGLLVTDSILQHFKEKPLVK